MTKSESLSEAELQALHSKDYADSFEAGQDPMRIARIIERIPLKEGTVVGDFGCGNALSLEYLDAARVGAYYGVDFSKELLAYARKRRERLDFKQAAFFSSSVQEFCKDREGQIDVALALDFSEHVYDKDWLEILRSIHAVLKPGGSLYIHTPNARFFLEKMKKRNFIVKQLPEHIAVRSANENTGLLEKAGFPHISVEFIPHYNVLKYLHPLSHIPVVGPFFQARLLIAASKAEAG